MKKNLFLLASLGVLVFAKAQILYVAPDTQVKVKSGALLYVDGSAKIANYTRDRDTSKYEYTGLDKKVSNEGNVYITGGLTNGEETRPTSKQGFSFVNELLPGGEYGQLIVDGAATNTGKITAELLLNKDFGYYSMAFPFTDGDNGHALATLYGYKIIGNFQGLTKELPGYKPVYLGFDPNRYKNPMFVFNYTSGEEGQALDNLDKNASLEPGKYYAFNVKYNTLEETLPDGKTPDSKKFLYSFVQGTPNNKETSITVYPYTISNNKAANKYGEQFGSYVIDFTKEVPAGFKKYGDDDEVVEAGDFGSNIFLLGNPFTSNINLLADNASGFKDATAIVQFTQERHYDKAVNDYNGANKNGTHSDAYGTVMTGVTGDGTGNASTMIVRPYQTFAIKMAGLSGAKTFKFTDKMKTFEAPENATNVVLDMPAARSEKEHGIAKNQLGLDLYDNNGFTGVQTYIVASDIYEAAKKGKGIELTNTTVKDKNTSLYTLQEKEDGSTIDDKAYINGVNADKYVGKPIHLVLQNAKGQYTIKGDLNKDLSDNKNAFYFEDKKEGKVLKVGKDFSYTFNAEGTDKDRFVLYWAKTPKAELSKDLANEVKSLSSVIYKDAAGTYKVRFDKAIKKADVFVYNISGQLVNVAKSVDTASDYVVPVKGDSSIYVVKVVGDNGSVTTKKIIK